MQMYRSGLQINWMNLNPMNINVQTRCYKVEHSTVSTLFIGLNFLQTSLTVKKKL